MSEKVDTESFKEFARLRELRVSHRDLDYLKDMIVRLESELIPDLDA
jgi:hypothetical protein